MRIALTSAALAVSIAGSAFAQNYTAPTNPAAAPQVQAPAPASQIQAPANPAIKTTDGNNPGAPVPGANSFTEGQAKSHIEARGYVSVTGLVKDTNGFWRGRAMKDGKEVNVALDYQGNVVLN